MHFRLPKREVIKWVATHTNLDLTKTWPSMDVEVITMRCQNLLMKIQYIIDPKDTTVISKVISMILLLAYLSNNKVEFII